MTKQSTELEAAQAKFNQLLEQKKQLQSEISRLEGDPSQRIDLLKPEAIGKIEARQSRIAANQEAVKILNGQIEMANRTMEAIKTRERETQAANLRLKEQEAYKQVISCLLELDQAITYLTGIHGELASKYGLLPKANIPSNLILMVNQSLVYFRTFDRESLGLPPPPTAKEIRRWEANNLVLRMQQRLDYLKNKAKDRNFDVRAQDLERAELDLEMVKRQAAEVV